MEAVGGLIFIKLFWLVAVGLSCVLAVFWIWMLVDCAMNESSDGNTKIVWVLIIIFATWIGAVIYFFARRPKRKAELGR